MFNVLKKIWVSYKWWWSSVCFDSRIEVTRVARESNDVSFDTTADTFLLPKH